MNLTVDPDILDVVVNSIRSNKENLSTYLGQISTANANISSSWAGDSAKAYTSKIEEQAKIMDDMIATIESICETMSSIASAYRNAEAGIAGALNGGGN